MFYSTEILTNKSSALSTVWRAGNTAPGASTTGIHRKAVLDVDIERACTTIIHPPGAPIALRLQGTLLYGTARIYQEKCRFVLTDSERIQRAMLKLCHSLLDSKIDKNAGRAKPAQIALPDDPGFALDLLQLPPFDFNAAEDASLVSQSRQESWTMMSSASRRSHSQLAQIVLDADSSGPRSYADGFAYSASGASNMQDSPTPLGRQIHLAEDDDNLLPDIGLFIDANGNIVEEELHSEPQLPAFPPAKARQAAADENLPMILDDDELAAPAVQPLVQLVPPPGDAVKAVWLPQTSSPSQTLSTAETASSKQARAQARRLPKFVDEITQIPHREYYRSVANYAQNMQQAAERKDRARSIRRAHDMALNRQAAYDRTLGRGIFGVAAAVKPLWPDHPLPHLFAGDALEQTLFGGALQRAKRRMISAAEPSTPAGRVLGGLASEDQDIELGRQPASALSDNPSLQLNRHSSLPPGSSAHGSVQRSAGLGRHVPGSGPASAERFRDPSFIERYSDDDLDLLPPFHSNSVGPSVGHSVDGVDGFMAPPSSPAQANAGPLPMVADFWALVQTKAAAGGVGRAGHPAHRWVDFNELVAPFRRSRPAVVDAFMSLLSLATARRLRIHQDRHDNERLDETIFVGVRAPKTQRLRKRSFAEMSDAASQDERVGGRVPAQVSPMVC